MAPLKDKGSIEFDKYGAPVRGYGAIIDITEQKILANEQPRIASEDFHKFINSMLAGIWSVDQNDVTTFVNSAITQMLGYTEDELVGISMFSFTDAEWNSVSFKKFSDRKIGRSESYKMQLRKKDGSGIWCLILANPIFEHGQFLGTVTVITDFSEHQDAISAKDRRIAELEAQLASRE